MTTSGKKICSLFLALAVVAVFGMSCLFVGSLPKRSAVIELVAKYGGVVVKTVPFSVCCKTSYINPLIRTGTAEDSFYPVTAGDAELQKNINIRQFNERNFFTEENDLPVPNDVPDENSPKKGQKWWPVPMIAVMGIALIAAAEKIFFGRRRKHHRNL